MSSLIGKLQSTLLVGSWNFAVSPELRRQTESEMIADAVAVIGTMDIVFGEIDR